MLPKAWPIANIKIKLNGCEELDRQHIIEKKVKSGREKRDIERGGRREKETKFVQSK